MTKDNQPVAKMETLRSDADLQAIQTSVAFKNISDAIEQYRRQFGVAFLALIAFSAIHVGLVVIANLYTLQTRVTHGVLTSTENDSQPVGTSGIVERVDLQFIMTNMNEVQQLRALNSMKDVSFSDKNGDHRQYTVTGYQLGGWRRSELKLYTSVGHVLLYVRGTGLKVLSESGSTMSPIMAAATQKALSAPSGGRHLLFSSGGQSRLSSVSASLSQDTSSASQAADEAIAETTQKVARWRALYSDSLESLDAATYYQVSAASRDSSKARMDAVQAFLAQTSGASIQTATVGALNTLKDGVSTAFSELSAEVSAEGEDAAGVDAIGDFVNIALNYAIGNVSESATSDVITEVLTTLTTAANIEEEAFRHAYGSQNEDGTYANNGGWFGQLAKDMYSDVAGDSLTLTAGVAGDYGCTGVTLDFATSHYNKDVSFYASMKCTERSSTGQVLHNYAQNGLMGEQEVHGAAFTPWVEGHFFSTMLGYVEHFTTFFPATYCSNDSPKIPSVFMLHGFGGDDGFVHYIARALDYAFQFYWEGGVGGSGAEAGSAGIMAPPWGFTVTCPLDGSGPMGKKSWYLNTLFTGFHMDFIAFELRLYLIREARILHEQQNKAGIFGFSMGGFGAFQLIFAYPNHFGFGGLFNGPVDGNDCFYTDSCFMWCLVDPGFCEILWISIGIIFNHYVIMRAGADLNSPNSASPMMHGNAVDLLDRGHYSGMKTSELFASQEDDWEGVDGLKDGEQFVNCLAATGGGVVPAVYVPSDRVGIVAKCYGDAAQPIASNNPNWMGRLTTNTDSPAMYGPPAARTIVVDGKTVDNPAVSLNCPQKYGCVMYCIEQMAWLDDRMGQWDAKGEGMEQIGANYGVSMFWVNPVYSTMATQYFCPTMNVLTEQHVTECHGNFVNNVPLGQINSAYYSQFGPSAVHATDETGQWLFMSVDAADEYGIFHGALLFASAWMGHIYHAGDSAAFAMDVYMFDHTGSEGHNFCQDDLRKVIAALSDYYFSRVVRFHDQSDSPYHFTGWTDQGSYNAFGEELDSDGNVISGDDDFEWWSYDYSYGKRHLLAGGMGYYFRPPTPPEPTWAGYRGGNLNMHEWFAQNCNDDANCVPMCFMWPMPISETVGMYEKITHNSLGESDTHEYVWNEETETWVSQFSESALCDMNTYMTVIGLAYGDGSSSAKRQPSDGYFDAETYAAASAHNEHASGHVGEGWEGFKDAPDGYVMQVPAAIASRGKAAVADFWTVHEDYQQEQRDNMTAAMEDAVFIAFGAGLKSMGDLSEPYACLTAIFNDMVANPLTMAIFSQWESDKEVREASYTQLISTKCPEIHAKNVAAQADLETLLEELEEAGEGGEEAPSVAEDTAPSYWMNTVCKGDRTESYCGWNQMEQEEVVEYNINQDFASFEHNLVDSPYSEATCELEMAGKMNEIISHTAEMQTFVDQAEQKLNDVKTAEANRLAATCTEAGTIAVPQCMYSTSQYKSFKHGCESVCITNPAGEEHFDYKLAQANVEAEIVKAQTELDGKSNAEMQTDAGNTCTPQDVYDFFTVNWYCYYKNAVQGNDEVSPFKLDEIESAYKAVADNDGTYSRPNACWEGDGATFDVAAFFAES